VGRDPRRGAQLMPTGPGNAEVIAVASSKRHRFAKTLRQGIVLLPGLGVERDAHCGTTVQHRSRLARTADAPNLRQVHLIHAELFDEMAQAGFTVAPGELGENVTTRGIDLLGLPRGARLRLGETALVELTGLRNPCRQIDDAIGPGAMAATLARAPDGSLIRKAGVMAVVLEGGQVRPGCPIGIERLPKVLTPLEPV
jgi:MOSC domain-containing protein YiiM